MTSPNQPIQERLAAVWESHMHDGNGAHVTAALHATLTAARTERRSFAPGELREREISTAFEPFENEAEGGMVWALMDSAVAAMCQEYRAWARARIELAGPTEENHADV